MIAVEHSQGDRYGDNYDVQRRLDRIQEAEAHLGRINDCLIKSEKRPLVRPELLNASFTLVEVGPGSGATTVAIKNIFPLANITALDRDDRSQASLVGQGLVEKLLVVDLFNLDDEQGREIFQSAEIAVALRTSVQLGVYLMKKLQEWGFKGQFVFSWIDKTDEVRFPEDVRLIRQLVLSSQITNQYLVEGRAFNEEADVVDYSQPLHLTT